MKIGVLEHVASLGPYKLKVMFPVGAAPPANVAVSVMFAPSTTAAELTWVLSVGVVNAHAEKATDPQGPLSGERRVIRGGAFNGGYASWLRPSFRYGQVPAAQSHGIGFRCAGSVTKP